MKFKIRVRHILIFLIITTIAIIEYNIVARWIPNTENDEVKFLFWVLFVLLLFPLIIPMISYLEDNMNKVLFKIGYNKDNS